MKVSGLNKDKKEKNKKKGGIKPKPKKEQVLVVAQEIKYARWLSGNDKKTRDKVLKALKKWILNCFEKGYQFKEEDFTRVWKGLFYAVWMSDKPLIQEELCENISSVLDLFPPDQLQHALLMTKAGFRMLATEWYGIDHHRMDKFLMLVRRYLRGSLRCLQRCGWSLPACQEYAKMLSGTDGLFAAQTPHYARNATSLLLHVADCFLEELAKVSQGSIPGESVAALLRPFVLYTCSGGVLSVCTAARRVLTALLRQSDAGLEYAERTRAWRQMGCPEGGPDALEPASDDEDETLVQGGDLATDDDDDDERSGALDPRAGRVDVLLAPLPVPASLLADMLADLLATASSKAHRRLAVCAQKFKALAAGEYPLGLRAAPAPPPPRPRPRRAAAALRRLEHELRADADELKLRGLSRKHRRRLLRKSRAGLSIVEDVEGGEALSKESNNGDWIVESAETSEKSGKDSSNKENRDKKKNKAKKRKNDAQQTERVSDKKRKLDNDSDNKKNILTNNKMKKNNIKVKENKNTENIKLIKDVKPKESKASIKNDAKDVKTKKPKNLPQIISDKKEKSKVDEKSNNTAVITKHKQKSSKIDNIKPKKETNSKLEKIAKKSAKPTVLVNKVKNFQKQLNSKDKKELPGKKSVFNSPKKVKFELKKNSMQKPVDYYKSVRQSPNIPFDSSKRPSKTNLKPSIPSPINPFFKKKLRMKL